MLNIIYLNMSLETVKDEYNVYNFYVCGGYIK
jgi:hypothetical protein